ncbi:unnamed protein product [Malus baccata var. baccata]
MVDWSSLPQELVIFIASRIALMEDFVVFGAVCKSWRWAATKENFTSRLTHQVPFLMLPSPKADDAFREFYSLTKDKIHKLNLPEAKGKGRFYAVTYGGMVLVCDTEDPKQPKTRVVVPEIPIVVKHHSPDKKVYVVESAGDLLVVFSVQEMDNFPIQRPYHTTIREWLLSSQKQYRTTHRQFKVFKVPLSGGSWRLDSEVKKLGNRSLFMGDNNSSFSVEASNYLGCKANCIYYYSYTFREVDRAGLSPLNGNIEMGVFNMEDGSTEQHFGSPNFALEKTNFPSAGTPCAWIQPSF